MWWSDWKVTLGMKQDGKDMVEQDTWEQDGVEFDFYWTGFGWSDTRQNRTKWGGTDWILTPNCNWIAVIGDSAKIKSNILIIK